MMEALFFVFCFVSFPSSFPLFPSVYKMDVGMGGFVLYEVGYLESADE